MKRFPILLVSILGVVATAKAIALQYGSAMEHTDVDASHCLTRIDGVCLAKVVGVNRNMQPGRYTVYIEFPSVTRGSVYKTVLKNGIHPNSSDFLKANSFIYTEDIYCNTRKVTSPVDIIIGRLEYIESLGYIEQVIKDYNMNYGKHPVKILSYHQVVPYVQRAINYVCSMK